jgi:dTMP kinase
LKASVWRLTSTLKDWDVVVLDRYVRSNMAYKGATIHPRQLAPAFTDWAWEIEFDVFRMPRPSLIVLIDMPVTVSAQRVAQKPSRKYTNQKVDLHQA